MYLLLVVAAYFAGWWSAQQTSMRRLLALELEVAGNEKVIKIFDEEMDRLYGEVERLKTKYEDRPHSPATH